MRNNFLTPSEQEDIRNLTKTTCFMTDEIYELYITLRLKYAEKSHCDLMKIVNDMTQLSIMTGIPPMVFCGIIR